jgi:hypothetical protein
MAAKKPAMLIGKNETCELQRSPKRNAAVRDGSMGPLRYSDDA